MNRGILLSRGVPTKADLIKSAEGICSGSNNNDALSLMKPFIVNLATGYYKVYKEQEREYFGLRDFYSLVKMVSAKVAETQKEPEWPDIVYAVQRYFGGYFGKFQPANVFLKSVYPNIDEAHFMPPQSLIKEAIRQKGETRYILLLTKNNAALNIVQEKVRLFYRETIFRVFCNELGNFDMGLKITSNMTGRQLTIKFGIQTIT
jgi:hypothetical protein